MCLHFLCYIPGEQCEKRKQMHSSTGSPSKLSNNCHKTHSKRQNPRKTQKGSYTLWIICLFVVDEILNRIKIMFLKCNDHLLFLGIFWIFFLFCFYWFLSLVLFLGSCGHGCYYLVLWYSPSWYSSMNPSWLPTHHNPFSLNLLDAEVVIMCHHAELVLFCSFLIDMFSFMFCLAVEIFP